MFVITSPFSNLNHPPSFTSLSFGCLLHLATALSAVDPPVLRTSRSGGASSRTHSAGNAPRTLSAQPSAHSPPNRAGNSTPTMRCPAKNCSAATFAPSGAARGALSCVRRKGSAATAVGMPESSRARPAMRLRAGGLGRWRS